MIFPDDAASHLTNFFSTPTYTPRPPTIMSLFTIDKVKVPSKERITPSNMQDILPNHPARVMFVGASRSGKTNLIVNLLLKKQFYKNYFHDVIIISPNVFTDEIWMPVIKEIQPRHLMTQFDAATLHQLISEQRAVIETVGIDKSPRLLFVLDDIIEEKELLNSPMVSELLTKGRHLNASVWVSAQSFNKIPRALRLQMSNIIIFGCRHSELEVLCHEFCPGWCEKNQFKDIFAHATKAPFSFLHINLQVDSAEQLRRNWENIIRRKKSPVIDM
jgi:hypothetical protein